MSFVCLMFFNFFKVMHKKWTFGKRTRYCQGLQNRWTSTKLGWSLEETSQVIANVVQRANLKSKNTSFT